MTQRLIPGREATGLIKAVAWKHPLEPTSVFQAGAARPTGSPWGSPGQETGAPPAIPGSPGTQDAGPAAIVTISPEARAAQADEPLPALLGQRQLTAADNLPRAGIPDEVAAKTGISDTAGPKGAAGKPGTTGAAEGAEGGKETQAAKGTEGDGRTGAPGDPEEAEGAGSPGPQDAKKEDAAPETQGSGSKELSAEEEQVVKELQARDREVRAHEAAHLAAAGGISKGGASFTYQSGPDGRQYAIGGEVNIDTSAEKDPRATVAKARQIQAAANAPAEPSGQDRAVAAAAAQMAAEAQAELAKQGQEEMAKAMGGGKDEGSKGQPGQPQSGEEPHGAGKVVSAALSGAEPGKPAPAEPGKPAPAEPGRPAAAEPGRPAAASRAGSGKEPPATAASVGPVSDSAGPTNDSAAPANEGAAPAPRAATPFVDPHEHPDGPGNCSPCGKLASTRVATYA